MNLKRYFTGRYIKGGKELVLFAMSVFMAAGCSDDVTQFKGTVSGDGAGITLLIPDVDGAAEFGNTRSDGNGLTRAESAPLEAEGKINNIYLVTVDANEKVTRYNLTGASTNIKGTYREYHVNIPDGVYSMYLLTNLDDYITDGVSSLRDAEALNEAVLHFADNSESHFLVQNNLPMACIPEDIRIKTTDGETTPDNYKVTISTISRPTIVANLTFLCCKVRYTILADQKSFSSGFDVENINFNQPLLYNVRKQTAITYDGTASDEIIDPSAAVELNPVSYPAANSPYFDIKNATTDNYPTNLAVIESGQTWSDAQQRAWQGVIYVPENIQNVENKNKLTSLEFTGTGGKLKEGYPLTPSETDGTGILRGKLYDIVNKLTDSGSAAFTSDIKVSDWNRLKLAYQLHGPYELMVEKTQEVAIKSGYWTVMGFDSNVTDDDISFEFPKLKLKINNVVDSVKFYEAEVIREDATDEEGKPYVFDDGWDRHFRISVNSQIPYSVLRQLNPDVTTGEFKDEDGHVVEFEDLKYFHIVAGNLHKHIGIEPLELDPFLTVSPQEITIDVKEYYSLGNDYHVIPISFHTNCDDSEEGVSFTVSDPTGFLEGRGNGAITITYSSTVDANDDIKDKIVREGDSKVYKISTTSGVINLNLRQYISGNPYWNQHNQCTLTFTLTLPTRVITKTVTIKVKPFSSTYTIYFRDNTKQWISPHIYAYQILTLPTDLTGTNALLAGKPVGYVENNPNSGEQWNSAHQYTFSNNLSFRGWKGYGGPDINDPNEEAYCTPGNPDGGSLWDKGTYGFVMFGKPDEGKKEWNYSYCYTYNNGMNNGSAPNPDRDKRYNYNVNLNEDHFVDFGKWKCTECQGLYPYMNGGSDHQRFYTGISMADASEEVGEEGWWKYTLSGLAQPGRTVIIFADYHEPWENEPTNNKFEDKGDWYKLTNHTAEDHRFPGDYEAAIPLFDYSDNEGWFLFNGNTNDRDQNFSDKKPTNTIPYKFTPVYTAKMRIECYEPTDGSYITDISIGGTDFELKSGDGLKYIEISNGQGLTYNTSSNDNVSQEIPVTVKTSNGVNKTYNLAPKYFKKQGDTYVTAHPLHLEYRRGDKFYIKWSDNIEGSEQRSKMYLFLYAYNWQYLVHDQCLKSGELGNYKHVEIDLPEFNFANGVSRDILILKPERDSDNADSDPYRRLKVEELPEYYNPASDRYLINWYLLHKD